MRRILPVSVIAIGLTTAYAMAQPARLSGERLDQVVGGAVVATPPIIFMGPISPEPPVRPIFPLPPISPPCCRPIPVTPVHL
jgi:hypothetical protein